MPERKKKLPVPIDVSKRKGKGGEEGTGVI